MENGDASAVQAIAELVLGCAVHCARKEQYITAIMQLPDDTKIELMTVIQHLLGLVSTAVKTDRAPDTPVGESARAPSPSLLHITASYHCMLIANLNSQESVNRQQAGAARGHPCVCDALTCLPCLDSSNLAYRLVTTRSRWRMMVWYCSTTS